MPGESTIAYGAWIRLQGKDARALFRGEEAWVRSVLCLEHPEELVDRNLDELRRAVERELRRQ